VQGTPLALFRDSSGAPRALLDRCAHRNLPLSHGRCEGGDVRCGYHGWRFDGAGACREVPGRANGTGGGEPATALRVPAFATRERDGFVWVWGTPDEAPVGEPFRFPHLHDPRYGSIRRSFRVRGSMHAAIENALDVPHTAFLHRGLHRDAGEGPHEIEVRVRRLADRAEAEFVGEPRPRGLAGRFLAPGGGVVSHVDRFLLPCVAQVEYRIGDDAHVVLSAAHTPVDEETTDVHAIGVYRLRVPRFLVRVLGVPIARRILGQDQAVLRAQAACVRRFGGEAFASTELDVLGAHVRRLLEAAARGEVAEPFERRLTMRI
jgi:phenylpropionate dioxygenase-like ring-hydroxylating dioxygenase large terminal subunit